MNCLPICKMVMMIIIRPLAQVIGLRGDTVCQGSGPWVAMKEMLGVQVMELTHFVFDQKTSGTTGPGSTALRTVATHSSGWPWVVTKS